ncbi:MAG: DUF1802 family protein [Cyanobacteria bacterium J06633_23]
MATVFSLVLSMLSHALKEWSIAVDALVQGQTILLLRKGGIREKDKHFTVPRKRVWLYPTHEHQKPHLLKPQWAKQVTQVEPGWHPTQVTIKAWADIAQVWTVRNLDTIKALQPFHIWNGQFVTERFRWQPNQPLHLLLLRVHGLTSHVQLGWQPDYGGCRSWLNLKVPIDELPSAPVLDQTAWVNIEQKIHDQINTFEPIEPLQGNEIV